MIASHENRMMTNPGRLVDVDHYSIGSGISIFESSITPPRVQRFVTLLPIKMHSVLKDLDQIHRDTVFFDALFGSIFNLEITVPFYSEHCVLHLDRREERRELKLQSLAHGEAVIRPLWHNNEKIQ